MKDMGRLGESYVEAVEWVWRGSVEAGPRLWRNSGRGCAEEGGDKREERAYGGNGESGHICFHTLP